MFTKIVLSGVKVGTIWMPAATCHKEFRETYTHDERPFSRPWHGLRDALCDIVNDGDFRSCDIADCILEVHRPIPNGHTITYHEIKRCKAISDVYDPSRMDDVLHDCDD